MEEKRNFDRWSLNKNAYIDLGKEKKEVKILDVSVGGMRVVTDTPLEGDEIKSEFKILPNMGPFFAKGKVVWTTVKEGTFESGIVFNKVSTIPLS